MRCETRTRIGLHRLGWQLQAQLGKLTTDSWHTTGSQSTRERCNRAHERAAQAHPDPLELLELLEGAANPDGRLLPNVGPAGANGLLEWAVGLRPPHVLQGGCGADVAVVLDRLRPGLVNFPLCPAECGTHIPDQWYKFGFGGGEGEELVGRLDRVTACNTCMTEGTTTSACVGARPPCSRADTVHSTHACRLLLCPVEP